MRCHKQASQTDDYFPAYSFGAVDANVKISPANTRRPQDLALLVEKLDGAIVATHSQSGIRGQHLNPHSGEKGPPGSAEGVDWPPI